MSEKKVIYSGIKPTVDALTLGNYLGAVKNWLSLQEDENSFCIYAIADLHALTVRQVPAELRSRTLSFIAQYLAVGLDPAKNIVYVQSHVPAHAELSWVLNCYTYVGEASRMTQFKEKSAQHADNINMGLMDYPVLMASDILLYQTDLVPVGEDQKQHVELARDIANRFNNAYSPTFTVPEPYMPKFGARIKSLQDPSLKMSKTDENPNAAISILESPDDILRKFKRAVTDSDARIVYSPADKPGISNLLTIYTSCAGVSMEAATEEFAGMNYADFKLRVADAVIAALDPIRLTYQKLMGDKAYLAEVMKTGAERAEAIARKTLSKVYKKVGLVSR